MLVRSRNRKVARASLGVRIARTWLPALALITGLSLPARSIAVAQDSKDKKHDEELLLGAIPSVFGASRFDQSVTEAPASVSVVTAAEINAHGWRTLADLLRTVRGFYVSDDRSYSGVGARGFARPGDYNTRILILVDGVRVNEPIFDGAYVGTESIVNLNDVERVEVIRGPASSLYGTNALFAIVNVITMPGRSRPTVAMRGSLESFGTRDVDISAAHRVLGGATLSGSLATRRSDGRTFLFPEYRSATSNGIASGVDADEANRMFAKGEWKDFILETSLVDRTKHVPTAPYDVTFDDPRYFIRDRLQLLSLAYKKSLDASSELAVTASAHRYDYGSDYPRDGDVSTEWAHARWGIFDAQYSRLVAGRNRLLLGGMFQHNVRQEQVIIDPATRLTTLSDNTTSDNWALYALGEFRFGSRVILNTGLRQDYARSLGANFNPRAALIYRLGEGSALKALYGNAFRAPNNFERFYSDNGESQKGNPSLAPEHVSTYELLLEKLVSRHVKGSISAYQYETRKLIDLSVDTTDGLQQFRNIGRATGRGVESEIEVEFGDMTARASYAIQRAWDPTTDATLTNSPRHLAFATMVVPLLDDRLRGAVELRAMSSRVSQTRARVPGHAVTNVVITSHTPFAGASVLVGVYNLFNTRYGDPVGEEVRMTAIPQDTRALRMTLTWSH